VRRVLQVVVKTKDFEVHRHRSEKKEPNF
jgi:hypothetical protein